MHKKSITCINGQFVPTEQATINVSDRGFRFGDGVFETIRVINGTPYQWESHLSRMSAGLMALRITPPNVDWVAIARKLILQNSTKDGFLRIAVSRGVGSQGYLPSTDIQPTWVIEILPPTTLPDRPLTLWYSHIRRPPLSCLPANHKLAHGIGSTLALLEAREHGCDEALMLSSDGMLSECASGNIFWISDDKLFTPSLSSACLAGTTRAALMRLFPDAIQEVLAPIAALANAEAMFLTNTRLGVWPIAAVATLSITMNPSHPMIARVSSALEADRIAYVTSHHAQWIGT